MSYAPPKAPIFEANRLSKLLNISRGTERFPVDVEELARGYAPSSLVTAIQLQKS